MRKSRRVRERETVYAIFYVMSMTELFIQLNTTVTFLTFFRTYSHSFSIRLRQSDCVKFVRLQQMHNHDFKLQVLQHSPPICTWRRIDSRVPAGKRKFASSSSKRQCYLSRFSRLMPESQLENRGEFIFQSRTEKKVHVASLTLVFILPSVLRFFFSFYLF